MSSKNNPTKQHKIILFGAGNMAYHLGMALKKNGINIIQIYNRSADKGKDLAQLLQVPYTNSLSDIKKDDANIFIFAVADDAIGELIKFIGPVVATLLHTAGSVDASVFKEYSENYGVIYPFQTLSREKQVDFSEVNFFIEGSDKATEELVKSMAERLSRNVYVADSKKRMLLHIAGVFSNNFTNHLMAVADQILKKIDIPFEVLIPLITETVEKVNTIGPLKAQTGPAKREDYGTILKHLEQLENRADLQVLYNVITESIINFNKE
jgi:predicted short-subunit dehydrogenase-like oxidoreductase (DUF2520 family)